MALRLIDDPAGLVAFETAPTGLLALLGALLASIGVLVLALAWSPWSLTCQVPGDCVITNRGLVFHGVRRFPAERLMGAKVVHRKGRKGSFGYRLVLMTSAGDVPVTAVWNFDEDGKFPMAEALSRFAHEFNVPRGPLRLADDDLGTAVGSGGLAVGGAWLFAVGRRRWRGVFRPDGTLALERRGPLGRRATAVPADGLTEIATAPAGRGNGRPALRITFLAGGQVVMRAYAPDDANTAATLDRLRDAAGLGGGPVARLG